MGNRCCYVGALRCMCGWVLFDLADGFRVALPILRDNRLRSFLTKPICINKINVICQYIPDFSFKVRRRLLTRNLGIVIDKDYLYSH